jgi:hypothetical protein
LKEIEAKLAVAIVRYSGDVPADKAFYHAGMACKVFISKINLLGTMQYYNNAKKRDIIIRNVQYSNAHCYSMHIY